MRYVTEHRRSGVDRQRDEPAVCWKLETTNCEVLNKATSLTYIFLLFCFSTTWSFGLENTSHLAPREKRVDS